MKLPLRRRGQAIVELAFVLPLFLLIVSGTIEFGRAYYAYAQLLQAAQEGARYGAVIPDVESDQAIIARVQQVAPGRTADRVTIQATVSPTNSTAVGANSRGRGNVLSVTVHHDQAVLLPALPLPSLPMTVTVSMVIEKGP
ncbi:MAG TPA: TadE family protein [Chloroflexota bacterium]|nr:TadE family protein [Chloroflexota bacterium]